MKEFIFKFEGKNYITDADTLMDAEMKFWDEFGYDPETCIEKPKELKDEDMDKLIYSDEEAIYF